MALCDPLVLSCDSVRRRMSFVSAGANWTYQIACRTVISLVIGIKRALKPHTSFKRRLAISIFGDHPFPAAIMSDSSTPSPSVAPGQSSKARKKQRQRQKKKAAPPDQFDNPDSPVAQALQHLERSPTVANGFRAWLIFLHHTSTPLIHRSAANFARVFQIECIRASGRPSICETQLLTARFLEFSISEFAGCFILDKNIENPSKIARISSNLCCFTWFLGKHGILPVNDVQMLHDLCSDIGHDMIRSARAERVGEAYSSYVRETYEDSGTLEEAEDISLFNGGFEVAFVGGRFCLLTDFGESGLNHTAFRKIDPVKVRFPLPLTRQLKQGDHIHLEIRRMKKSAIWLPTECFGVYPDSGEDDGNPSSTETAIPVGESKSGTRSELSLAASLSRINLNSEPAAKASSSEVRGSASYKAMLREQASKDLTPDGFDEDKFTDGYFSAFEVDIGDEDQGFGIFENENSDDGASDSEESVSP